MDVEQFKEDVRSGRIATDRLVELVVTLSRQLQEAKQRIEDLERKLGGLPTAKVAEPFSVKSEERRQEARGKKQRPRNQSRRRGRIKTADKLAMAARTEKIFPVGVPPEDCCLSHKRVVWRLENGQAVLVAYEVDRGPKNQYGKIPGVLGRSEFGIEIVLAIAYQVYVVGLSFDKVCLLMNFFYRTACRVQQDKRLSPAGREQRVGDLEDEILELCLDVWAAELPPGEGPADDYRLLTNELMRLMLAKELFTFVTVAAVKTPRGTEMPVAGTNNEAERTLRGAAQARKTGRTSKTLRGARRQTVIMSVLESLRVHLATFTLSGVIDEVRQWCDAGQSCFAKLLKKLKLPPPTKSALDLLLPAPSG